MIDVCFIALWFSVSYLLGLGLTARSEFSGRHFAAPVIGFAAIASIATLAYIYGATSFQCAIIVMMGAGFGGLLSLRRALREIEQMQISAAAAAGLAIVAIVFVAVAAKWTGGPQFYAMQINPYDQFNYLKFSSAIHDFTYQTIKAPPPGWAEAGNMNKFASENIDLRPAVNIVHAAFYWLFFPSAIEAYYPYMAFFQLLMALSLAFVMMQFSPQRPNMALLIGAGFSLGPLYQHAVDLNAWSQVAGMPLAFMVIALGYRVLALRDHSLASLIALSTTAAGLIFVYPEITTVVAVSGLAIAVIYILGTRDFKSVAIAFGACIVAAAIGSLYWHGTIGFLLNQLNFATHQSLIDWAAYYDGQLFGNDVDWWPYINHGEQYPLNHYQKASAIIDPTVGQMGLFYLLPTSMTPIYVRVVWKAAVIFFVAVLLGCGVVASRRTKRRILLAGLLAALIVPAYALINGHFWTAGKALGMAAPMLFILVTLPLVADIRCYWKIPALLFLAFHIGAGVWRPIAVAQDATGAPFPRPYPHFPTKTEVNWDVVGKIETVGSCNGINLNIRDPLLDTYVQLLLSSRNVPWSSLQPIRPVYDNTAPPLRQAKIPADCLVYDGEFVEGYRTLINLRRPSPTTAP